MRKTINRIDWPHVALAAIAAAFLLGFIALVLRHVPLETLEHVVAADWTAIVVGIVALSLNVWAMLRARGFLRDVGLEASDLGAAERRARDVARRRGDPTRRVDQSGRASIVVLAVIAGAAIATAAVLHGCGGAVLPGIAGAWGIAKPVTCAAARLYERLVCDVPESVDVGGERALERDAGVP